MQVKHKIIVKQKITSELKNAGELKIIVNRK